MATRLQETSACTQFPLIEDHLIPPYLSPADVCSAVLSALTPLLTAVALYVCSHRTEREGCLIFSKGDNPECCTAARSEQIIEHASWKMRNTELESATGNS